MKKYLLLPCILLTFFSCNESNEKRDKELQKDNTTFAGKIIPGQYIVIMKDSYEEPVIKRRINNPNRAAQREVNERARKNKEHKLKRYLKDRGVDTTDEFLKHIFADIIIGAVVTIDNAKAEELKADTDKVQYVIPNVTVQINPIQQTDPDASINPIQQWLSPVIPGTEINPIQQDDSVQNRYDIDTVRHWTKALITAGGPSSVENLSTVIWFLDTGIDPSSYLVVNSSLAISFVGESATNDGNGHGTFCAGVAAGKPIMGSTGLDEIHYGVSEGATVVPVQVLDQYGNGSWGTVIAGLNYVAKMSQPGDVVNLSLGAYDPLNPSCWFPGIENAIENVEANEVYVTLSAGNNAGCAECNRPGCINGIRIFTASSINADSSCAVYANFGMPVDYVTVGTRVFSLWNGGGFRMASGTSVSSAILAGIIHARGGIPAVDDSVNCSGASYPIGRR